MRDLITALHLTDPKVIVGAVCALGTLLLVVADYRGFFARFRPQKPIKKWTVTKCLFALWTILPPVWFMAEWSMQGSALSDEALDKFKYGQELASKVWLAIVGTLAVILKTGSE